MMMREPEAWAMKPRKLTIDELERPELVLDEFFRHVPMPQVREMMWEGFKVLVTGNFSRLNIRERSDLICFFEQLEKLVEGVHVLHSRAKTG